MQEAEVIGGEVRGGEVRGGEEREGEVRGGEVKGVVRGVVGVSLDGEEAGSETAGGLFFTFTFSFFFHSAWENPSDGACRRQRAVTSLREPLSTNERVQIFFFYCFS